MKVTQTKIPGLLMIQPQVFTDTRGYFLESYQQPRYQQAGIDAIFVQQNIACSERGVLRGLHYQIEHPQGKLLQVVQGEVFDVAVDLRHSSPTFGQWEGVRLSEENHTEFFVPIGCAHGYYVLSETATVSYLCTDTYYPEHERTLLWNDTHVGIHWPLDGEQPILSEKDQQGTTWSELEVVR